MTQARILDIMERQAQADAEEEAEGMFDDIVLPAIAKRRRRFYA